MAIKERKAGNGGILVNFVPKLGALFLVNDASTAAIKKAIADAGMGQTDSYTGYKGDTPSGKALKALAEQNINSVTLDGKLVDAKVFVNNGEKDGKKYSIPKLQITLEDTDGSGEIQRMNLALELGQTGCQMLARKLAEVRPGEHVAVNVFATYDKSDSDGKMYTNYGASAKVGDNEVKIPQDRSDALAALTADTKSKGATMGVSDEIVGQMVRSARTNWHLDLARSIEARFQAYRQADKAPEAPAQAPVSAEDHGDGAVFDLSDVVGAAAAEADALAKSRGASPRG